MFCPKCNAELKPGSRFCHVCGADSQAQQTPPPGYNQPMGGMPGQKQMLPNATVVLVMGICSIVFSCFFIGIILGIVGLVMSGKPRKMYKENPSIWDGYGSLNAGYIMSIIGTILGALYTIYWLIWVAILGSATMTLWNMGH